MRCYPEIRTLLLILIVVFAIGCGKRHKIALASKDDQIAQLQQQLDHIRTTNSSLLDRLSDMSVITRAGSESIKESLESINQQYAHIQDLTDKIHHKDSLNLALVLNLKRSLHDVSEEDLQVEVRGGKVHVSISDRMLFQSGSDQLSMQANEVLGKLAQVLNDHEHLDILIEGHTDNIPINHNCHQDNWDLSALRATTVTRLLHEEHFVSPDRMTAAGRAAYQPKASNSTEQGRALNRRTEIIILPRLDQFFKLLESPDVAG